MMVSRSNCRGPCSQWTLPVFKCENNRYAFCSVIYLHLNWLHDTLGISVSQYLRYVLWILKHFIWMKFISYVCVSGWACHSAHAEVRSQFFGSQFFSTMWVLRDHIQGVGLGTGSALPAEQSHTGRTPNSYLVIICRAALWVINFSCWSYTPTPISIVSLHAASFLLGPQG